METTTTNSPITRSQEKELQRRSPFELKNTLIAMAQDDARKASATFLNAGRGNPNWIATTPREAFVALTSFALQECRLSYDSPVGIAGIPASQGIAERFSRYLAEHSGEPGIDLLKGTLSYLVERHEADADAVVHEWCEGVIGDQYPTPDRILKFTEVVVKDYLELTMGGKHHPYTAPFDLFATEGGTAAMCYAFDSLQENFLLKKGDKIALMTPIFTPYIEIPRLSRYDFKVVNISANKVDRGGYHEWQYPDSEIDKLRDPDIKLLCVVNPSNPPSYAIAPATLQRIVDIVKTDNPTLMIVTDDVYGTFVEDFRSLMYELPYNTLHVYSFSKYFGATGWRLATIAINTDNVFDDAIRRLPSSLKEQLRRRYESITADPAKMKFIDRMVADSRAVALNHTAGLSTPQQIQMTLFASYILLDTEQHFHKAMMELLKKRLESLWKTTGFTLLPDPLRAGYYSEIDIIVWARKDYGDDFATYLRANYEPVDFVIRLARESATVLLPGGGFDGPKWSVRVSLANLTSADYLRIGSTIRSLLDEYYATFKSTTKR